VICLVFRPGIQMLLRRMKEAMSAAAKRQVAAISASAVR
jgi:hypothetical protein